MKRRKTGGQPSPLLPMVFLAAFFLAGVLLGQAAARQMPESAARELSDYLRYYLTLDPELSAAAAVSAVVLYIRYPLLALLLGFCSIGVVLLPCLTAAFGFFLSFSVCCFTAAFGGDGAALAFAVSGLRCLVTLPCYLILAVPAWSASASLAVLSFGRGRRAAPVLYGRSWRRRVGCCAAVLAAGVCVDLFCSPWLLRLALDRLAV